MAAKTKIIIFEPLPLILPPVKWQITKSNPNYWKNDGVRTSFKYVYAPSFPEIEDKYRSAKIRVFRPEVLDREEEAVEKITQLDNDKDMFDLEAGLMDDIRPKARVESEPKPEPKVDVEDEPVVERTVGDLPEQPNTTMKWRELSWPQMRGLYLTIKPASPRNLTKAQVIAGLEQCEADGLL